MNFSTTSLLNLKITAINCRHELKTIFEAKDSK